MQNEQKTKGIQSIDRAISILKCFYDVDSLGITELSRRINLHKSTTSNLVLTLEANGFLCQNSETKKYSLGPEICRLAANVSVNIRDIAYPYIREIMQICEETVSLGVRDGNSAVYLDTIRGPKTISSNANPGARFSVHACAFGRAILAYLPEFEQEEILNTLEFQLITEHTIPDRPALEACIRQTKELGYAVNHEEVEYGHVCVAAPILDYKNYPIASISVSGPAMRIDDEKIKNIGQLLVEKTGEISRSLGSSKVK